MALPSIGNTPPASANGDASAVGWCAAGLDGSAGIGAAVADGCSRAEIRCSRFSTRAVSRAKASRSSIISTRFEAGNEYWPNLACGCGVGERARIFLRPGRQELYQHPQNDEWQNGQHNGHQQSFACDQAHLVRRISQETLGKQLAQIGRASCRE